jgi:hypothetical protein
MLVAAISLLLSIFLTIGLLIYTGLVQKPAGK